MGLRFGTFQENYSQDMAILHTKLHWGTLFVFLHLAFHLPAIS